MFDSYITKDFYRETYPFVNAMTVDAVLDKAIQVASRVIDKITFQRATYKDTLTADEQSCIEYATAAQIDYIEGLGYTPINMSGADYNEGFSIGKYSSSGVQKGINIDARNIDNVSEKAREYLRVCNLTENGFSDHTYPSDYTFTDYEAEIR